MRLKLDMEDEHVPVSVTDSGPGIEPAVAESLFEPMVTCAREGVGMGLAISKSIAKATAESGTASLCGRRQLFVHCAD